MVHLTQLWLPILLSGILVFLASSLVHMLLKWHNSDYRLLPEEEAVMEAVRRAGATPGQYVFPHCADHRDLEKEEVAKRFERGPVGILTLLPSGRPRMGKSLGQWLLLTLGVGFCCAYLASHTLAAGAGTLQVMRLTGTIAFLSFAVGQLQGSIWMGRPWSATLKDVADAAIYAVVMGAVFGWLWPR